MSWMTRLVNAFRPGRTAAELDEELQFHIEQRIADFIRSGMTREDAERAARRQLGNRLRLRESSQEVKSAAWLESIVRDSGFGLRMLWKSRSSSLAAILSLGLASGACTAAFVLMDALILRPLPLPHPNQIFDIAQAMPPFLSPANQPTESASFSYTQYELLRDAGREYADFVAMTLSPGLQPVLFDDAGGVSENIRAESISGQGFDILGVKPAMGRLIQTGDDDSAANAVAVLSHAFWQRRFGGSVSALGRIVTIGRKQFQVVGIAAPLFSGVQPGYLTDVWVPLSLAEDPRRLSNPDDGSLNIWGRLHADVNRSQLREVLQPQLTHFLRERARVNPPRNLDAAQLQQITDAPLLVRDKSSGRDSLFRYQFSRPLGILALICGLLLLMACSNVANLMLARASARDTEMALRVALGAGSARLIQQMLIESAQLAAAASILGLFFAMNAAPAMVARLGSSEFPAWLDVAANARMLLFLISLSALTAVLFGMLPALRACSASPDAALKAGSARHSGRIGSLRWTLSAQIAVSVAVLFLSGMLLLSFRNLIAVDLGFDPNHVVLFDLAPRDPERHRRNAGAQLLDHIRQLPGVEAASISQPRPIGGDMVWIMTPVIQFPGAGKEAVRPQEVGVSRDFFNAMHMAWIAGRDFLPEEIAGNSSAVIVNQAFVDKFLAGQAAIGRSFEEYGDSPDPVRREIIGVVANARYNNLREPDRPSIYTPLRDLSGATLNVRSGLATASLIPRLTKEIETAAPELIVRGSISLIAQIDNTLIGERLLALLGAFFSVVSLLLAGVGLYGVVNYGAVRRTHEIGVRIVMGAQPLEVVRLIVTEAGIPVLAGVVFGMALGLGLSRYVAAQLFGITPTDFRSLTFPIAGILTVAAAGAVLPALRAARADPLAALRHE